MFLGYYRHFWNFEFKEGERIRKRREGGGRKILDALPRGAEKFWISYFLESLGKIKGHV